MEVKAESTKNSLTKEDSFLTCQLMSKLARKGNLILLKKFYEEKCPCPQHSLGKTISPKWNFQTCSNAALKGSLETLIWLREQGCPWDSRTCSNAALGGHFEVLIWARKNGCPWDEKTCTSAALNGHLPILHWLREEGCPWDDDDCLAAAYLSGDERVIRYVKENSVDQNRSLERIFLS